MFGLNGGKGTSKGFLLLRAAGCYHHLVYLLAFFLHLYTHVVGVFNVHHGQVEGFKAYVCYLQHIIFVGLNFKLSVNVGGRTQSRVVLYHYHGTRHGVAIGVLHHTFYMYSCILRHNGYVHEAQQHEYKQFLHNSFVCILLGFKCHSTTTLRITWFSRSATMMLWSLKMVRPSGWLNLATSGNPSL